MKFPTTHSPQYDKHLFISKPFRKYPVLRTFNDTKLTRKISTRLEETDKTRFRSARLVHVS